MTVTKQTPTQVIQSTIARVYSEGISIKAAQQAKVTLTNSDLRKHCYSFQLLPGLKSEIERQDPNVYVHIAINHESFERFFCCPRASRSCFGYSCRLIGVNGAHLSRKSGHILLLLAVGIDANGQVIILAWAVVESESLPSWEYFLMYLKIALPEFFMHPCVLVSDWEKGLGSAVLNN